MILFDLHFDRVQQTPAQFYSSTRQLIIIYRLNPRRRETDSLDKLSCGGTVSKNRSRSTVYELTLDGMTPVEGVGQRRMGWRLRNVTAWS